MVWLRLLKPSTATWNTPEHSTKGRVCMMMLMTQNMQLYERRGQRRHLLVDLRHALEEARLVAGLLVRTGASFLTRTTCTPLWVPRLAGRARNSRNAIVLRPPCYPSYRMHLLLLVTAAQGLLPLLLGALHKFVRWRSCNFIYAEPSRPIDDINSELRVISHELSYEVFYEVYRYVTVH
jgi:hypothetical protein